ncbi:MAG: bifunctional riboflavin kinase/FAD synthetase [Spirochaetes bacterium]|jgi:riboflavin kinase/FMN adenylyltransferase|nr:bifunctional riboflavin kinase/FAD synthetase [Spirochaetota bacterium]
MNVHRGIPGEKGLFKNPVVTLGSFDGVHLGHRRIFSTVQNIARQKGGDAIVITFTGHPRKVLTPLTPPKILTTPEEKLSAIGESGIGTIILLDFTREMADMNAAEFFNEIVLKKIGVIDVVVGYDHAFGRNREGTIDFLRDLSKTRGFGVTRVEPRNFYSRPVSSTWIRTEIEDGNVRLASALLGRNYGLRGTVTAGAGRGTKIGFPTANIVPDDRDKVVPGDGVYAVRVRTEDGAKYRGMLNIGTNPTFDGVSRSIEVNLFDFDGNLYDRTLEVEFVERLREEVRFASARELVAQLEKDRITAMEALDG